MANDNELLIRINASAKDALDAFDKVIKKSQDTQKILKEVGKISTIAFLALTGAVIATTKAYADYETALVGVGKTTDIQGAQLKKFGKEFQNLSKTIPISTNELLGIAQAAGQLGVTGEANLLKFTETIAKLGVATDLTGEEAATALTRILNVTGEGIGSIDVFSSVIVALGNNFAATESEIVHMTNEVSRSTVVFGVSAAEAAALGTAMKSMGVRAQLGGSVVGKSMLKIQKAINDGGTQFKLLEQLTGLTGDALKKTFETDATGVFKSFLEGINNLEGGTGAIFQALEQFGLTGDEVNKVLPVLAKNTGILSDALDVANKETKNATALNKEAAAAFNTTASRFKTLTNSATVAAVTLGEKLAPSINTLIEGLQVVTDGLSEMDEEVVQGFATFLKWSTVITGGVAALAAIGLAAIKLSAIIAGLATFFGAGAIAAGGFWAAVTGPIGLAVAGITAVTIGVGALINKIQGAKNTPKTLKDIADQIDLLRKRREELAKTSILLGGGPAELAKLDEEIARLGDLKDAKIAASKDFGTGSLLERPEEGAGIPLGGEAFGLPEQVPISPLLPEEDDSDLEALKEKEEAKTEIIDEESQKRIDLLEAENEVTKARLEQKSSEEIDFLKRENEIKLAIKQAELQKDGTLKEAELTNLKLQQSQLMEERKRFQEERKEIEATDREERTELESIAKENNLVLEDEFNEVQLEQLRNKILTKDELERETAQRKLETDIKRRNNFLRDEQAHGTTFAKLKQLLNTQEVQGAANAANQLVALTQSKNETLKNIGKSAALVRIGIDTSQGAIAAYQSLAGIPILGPGLGIGAAAAITLFGAEKAAEVTGAQSGALVTGGTKGIDSELFALGKGELVAPDKSFDEVVEGTARARGFEDSESDGTSINGGGNKTITVIVEPAENFIEIIEQKTIEAQVQNRGVA